MQWLSLSDSARDWINGHGMEQGMLRHAQTRGASSGGGLGSLGRPSEAGGPSHRVRTTPLRFGSCLIAAFLGTVLVPLPARGELSPGSEDRLIQDVRVLLADTYARAVDEAIPGTFEELATPHLRELEASRIRIGTESAELIELRNSIFEGKRPMSELPPPWALELSRLRAATAGLLRATHAQSGKLPASFTLFGLFSAEKQPFETLSAQHAVKLANLMALEAVGAHKVGEAARICAEELALARDVSHGALINQMVAVSSAAIALRTCRVVVASAGPADWNGLLEQIRLIQAGWYPFEATLEQEKLFLQLGPFYDALASSTKAALPPQAHLVVATGEERGFLASVRLSLFGGWARQQMVAKLEQLKAASRLPPPQADAAIAQIENEVPLAYTLATGGDEKGTWGSFLRRWRASQARLALFSLELKVRAWAAREGRLPSSWADLGMPPPLDPRTGLPIDIVAGDKAVRLVPRLDAPRTDDDLSVEVR